ncbi:hypothetical protein C8Q80DRAFT_1272754 [Daedaleopsis nitida]|nr:hypothetical protein C8Q80DRAFT_1272754 [Daedaleopsis nitida]
MTMGLVKRHNTVSEYSALVSTTKQPTSRASLCYDQSYEDALPGGGGGAHPKPSSRVRCTKSPCDLLRQEAAEWSGALCPPLADVQTVLARMGADRELTQARVMARVAPLASYATLFAVAVVAVRPQSFAERILLAGNVWTELARLVVVLLCGVMFVVSALKAAVFGFAAMCDYVLSMDVDEAGPGAGTRGGAGREGGRGEFSRTDRVRAKL